MTNRKQQIKELWQTCFDDSEDFIQLFFDRVYRERNVVTIEQEDKVVSALHMLPYKMHWCNTEIPVSYIYAACTAPSERGKGLMQKLLQKSFTLMKERGIWATILIPANNSLFEYYRLQGYTEVFDFSLQTYIKPAYSPKKTPPYSFIRLNDNDNQEWYAFFNEKLKERPACMLHTKKDFQTLIIDFNKAKGEVIGMMNTNDIPVGLAFSIPHQERSIFLKEILYKDEDTKKALLWELTHRNNALYAYYPTQAQLPDTCRLGMGMIIDHNSMIQQWKQHHPSHHLTIQELKEMDTHSLTSFLFDYPKRQAYMSLMMD